MDEPPPSPRFDVGRALAGLAGRKSALIYMHDNPDPDALAAALGPQTPPRARAGRDGDAGARRDRRARPKSRHGRHAGDAARAGRADRPRRLRDHRHRRQPARDRQQLAAAGTPDRRGDRSPPSPAGQRARPLVRHPPRLRRHLDDRLRVPADAWHPARRQAGDRLLLRAAHGDARPRPRVDRRRARPPTSRWSRWSITGSSTG